MEMKSPIGLAVLSSLSIRASNYRSQMSDTCERLVSVCFDSRLQSGVKLVRSNGSADLSMKRVNSGNNGASCHGREPEPNASL